MLRRSVKRILQNLQRERYEPYNFIEISRDSLLNNLRYIQRLHPSQKVIPVIKSNAYGHGINQVASILDSAGVSLVAVDGYFEAKTIIDSTSCEVLVMGAIKPENIQLLDTKRCAYVIQDIESLRALSSLNRKVRIHMELNTGMNRLGLSSQEMPNYLNYLKNHPRLQLEGVMSHLADADNTENDFTDKQVQVFETIVKKILADGWTPKYIHLAQTAGSTKIKSKYVNGIRLGIGLYGINPLQPSDSEYKTLEKLKPVLSLKSTVIKIQNVSKGDKISYNGIFTATRQMRIGVLPLGYYEGYPRELSNKGVITYAGELLPVTGRVCMNHTMVDLTASKAVVGSELSLISNDKSAPNSIENICKEHYLFTYQLVTDLSEKIKRTII